MHSHNKKAFSLIELSIVILVIGILIAGVTQSSRLVDSFKLATAKNLTKNSPVPSIADLEIWLEATNEENFGSNEIEEGDSIETWNDINPKAILKSSTLQPTTTRQPKYLAKCINDLPCVNFDGSDDVLIYDLNINYNVLPNITVFAVFKFSNGSSANQALFGNDNGSWDRFVLVRHTSANIGPSTGSTSITLNNLGTENVAKVFSVTFQNGVSNGSKAFLNGLESSVTFTENHSNTGSVRFAIGAIKTSGEQSINGGISEFILYSRALKTEERQSVEKYLGQKYGIKITE